MNCLFCNKSYVRTSGVQRFRKDTGYCSIECIESSRPLCLNCGTKITRNPGEILSVFIRRTYCCHPCAAKHATSYKRSDETRRKMSDGRKRFNATERGQDVIEENVERYKEWLSSDIGIATRRRQGKQFSEWRKTPDGIAWYERALAAKRTDESRAKLSASLTDFFKTERGQENREHYRKLYTGVPRSPETYEKMKQAIELFWNSPEGDAMAEAISHRMTNGLPETPYGPNWNRQRQKAIRRDSNSCQLEFLGNCEEDFVVQVHHIFPNRFFGYVPGENEYFRWANHLKNLVCLCRRCHRLCEVTRSLVPEQFLSNATEHYDQFVLSTTH